MPACSAARGGTLSAKVAGIPFKLDFAGTGTADVSDISWQVVAAGASSQEAVPVHWVNNVFVGEHWLLGRFRIDLDRQRTSTGIISGFHEEGGRMVAMNRNEFNFVFRFARLPRLAISTVEPIVNEAQIEGIPPIGSTFVVPAESRSLSLNLSRSLGALRKRATENIELCEVTVFPERNIAVDVVDTQRLEPGVARVSVSITNRVADKVRATYFVVDHEPDVAPEGDGAFFDMAPMASIVTSFVVRSTARNKTFDLPLFAGIYKPAEVRGSASMIVRVSF